MNNDVKANSITAESQSENFMDEISILDMIVLIMRNWWIIVLVGGILGIACYAYSKTTSVPTYRSTGQLYIDTQREQKTDDVNTNALVGARELMPTYIEILESRTFNSIISDAVDNKYSYEEIAKMTYLSQVEDTNIMSVNVVCVDERDSYEICNSIINLAADEILRVFEGGSVKIIDPPEEEPEVVVVNLYQRGIIGFIIGAALAILAIFLFNMFDTRIESSEEISTKYGLPILGEIPNLADLT